MVRKCEKVSMVLDGRRPYYRSCFLNFTKEADTQRQRYLYTGSIESFKYNHLQDQGGDMGFFTGLKDNLHWMSQP